MSTVVESSEIVQKFLQTVVQDVQEARERIRPYIYKTPLVRSVWLSEETTETSVYLKLESEQITGSLKARGAFNKICIVKKDNDAAGKNCSITTASSGNCGQACAFAMKTFGIEGKIFVPECANEDKMAAIKKFGGDLEIFGDDCVKAEARARQSAQQIEDCVYISPYNDVDVVHGQGTIGLEILEDLPDVDTIFVSVGGGGAVSGIATYIKSLKPSVKIIGCQPENSCVMFESVKAGKILDLVSHPTLSDGTAGGVDPGAFTFDLCCEYVDKWILVSEEEISQGMYFMLQKHHKLVEGAAAVCIAAYIKDKTSHRGKKIVLVICGANVGIQSVRTIISENSVSLPVVINN